MNDLREGMYFQIERVHQGGSVPITTDREFSYKAIYMGRNYANHIPETLLANAYDRALFVLYENEKFVLAPANFEPLPLLPEPLDLSFLDICYDYKPEKLFMSELKWKLLIRNLIKGKNIMLTGHAGTGKTVAARTAAKTLRRPYYIFRVGSMQDPRSSLIGNTFYSKERGTYFKQAEFIKAIQTPNAVIVLDEFSRAHPEAHNILLSILDKEQRCISLDESDTEDGKSNIIYVAKGVSFVATANIGTEYTGTRQIDRANTDRFSYIEVDMLKLKEETELCKLLFPTCDISLLDMLCKVSEDIRNEYLGDGGNLSVMMSTRMVLEAAELLDDGFSIRESLDATIVPLTSKDGGSSSERVFLNSVISKQVPTNKAKQRMTKSYPSQPVKKDVSPNNTFKKKTP